MVEQGEQRVYEQQFVKQLKLVVVVVVHGERVVVVVGELELVV